ncbi:MAG TPA: hypothetical protein VIQ98_08915, partial [Gemmatimonadales bacterium]
MVEAGPATPSRNWPWYTLVFVGGAGVSLLVGWLLAPTTESAIRSAGGVLQLLGLAAVAIG